MELVDLLDVAEDHVALAPEGLGYVLPHQLRYVVLQGATKQNAVNREPTFADSSRESSLIRKGTVTSIMYSRDFT